MTGNVPFSESASPAQSGPITIVPLYTFDEVKTAATPAHLVYNNGPLLTSVQVFTVFWGAAWQQSPLSDTLQNLNGFFDFILTSPLMDQMAEYSTATQKIGRGSRTGTTTITTPNPAATIADSDIQQMLNTAIANGTVPQATSNTLYFVYLPSGVAVSQGGQSSCQAFCGYHDSINGQTFYAVMPYPDCAGCASNLAPFDALTATSSHELCEAITDPVPGQGWYDQANGEIGDICAWQMKQVGNYTVQKEWSNSANSCI
ncbi:MAG: hypothetical protein H0W02_08425 [Ktedonobacteraceae bacterium]|nr:hypothetical protein [Ktedonobacteraceae bacterium]